MSVIETQIWEEIPDKKGYVRYVGQRKLVEVFNELEAYLKKEGICPEEYFLPTHDAQPDTLFPRGDIRCYAQWGGSEGIYIELEVLVGATKDSFMHSEDKLVEVFDRNGIKLVSTKFNHEDNLLRTICRAVENLTKFVKR